MNANDPDRLTSKQAAAYLGVSTRTLRTYAKLPGFPKPFRASRKNVTYSRAELAAWLASTRGKGS